MYFRKWIPTGANLEIFRFAVYITAPICLMLYVGSHTHDKLNIEDFWPDPNRLNRIPKDKAELRQEIERMNRERAERRRMREERQIADENK